MLELLGFNNWVNQGHYSAFTVNVANPVGFSEVTSVRPFVARVITVIYIIL